MDPKEKQKLILLFVIFGIVGIMLYVNLLLKPQFSRFLVMNRDYNAVKTRIRNAEALISNETGILKQYDTLSKKALAMEEGLTRQDQISGLLEDFSRTAEASRVKILRIKPLESIDEMSQSSFYEDFPILIEARAGYHECGLFIDKLEKMDRFIEIEDIDIRGNPDDQRHHDIKLRVNTYIAQ